MHPHLERHYNRLYGDTAGSDYNSDLDASFDVDSISAFDVSNRSSESDEPFDDGGWRFVHHVGQPQVLDQRHSEKIPFTGREADIRLGADGQQPAFPSATACFKGTFILTIS